MIAGVLGPRATDRAARWADGVYSWSGEGDREDLGAQLERTRQAWDEAGRTEPPRHLAGFWYSLADDAPARLASYVHDYMEFAGPEVASYMAGLQTRHNPDAVHRALDDYEALGVDECLLNPATAELAEIDRLVELLASR